MVNSSLVGVTHRMGYRESFISWCYTQSGIWRILYQLVLHIEWDIQNPLSVGVTHRVGYGEPFISGCYM